MLAIFDLFELKVVDAEKDNEKKNVHYYFYFIYFQEMILETI